MVVTPSGMTVFLQPATKVLVPVSMMALQLLGELYSWLSSSTVI